VSPRSGRPRIEGYAIISADGMIADADGNQPPSLIVKADQAFFRRGLDKANAAAHGRFSYERGPDAKGRKRLVLTRSIPALGPHPRHPKGLWWNPAGASLQQAWQALGLDGGELAVIGGTDVFALFLEIGYDAFHLTRADHAHLPGGRPVFPGVPDQSPEAILAARGLRPGSPQVLDAEAQVTLVTWERTPAKAGPNRNASAG
jgi:dihydrofolate reductase